jgi:NADPH-dependent curcumin reductase CurA
VCVPSVSTLHFVRLTLHRFDYASQYPRAIADLAAGLADGTIKQKFHIVKGLENAPTALPMLFSGGNTGKL